MLSTALDRVIDQHYLRVQPQRRVDRRVGARCGLMPDGELAAGPRDTIEAVIRATAATSAEHLSNRISAQIPRMLRGVTAMTRVNCRPCKMDRSP
jgi:hypothetical protein